MQQRFLNQSRGNIKIQHIRISKSETLPSDLLLIKKNGVNFSLSFDVLNIFDKKTNKNDRFFFYFTKWIRFKK